MWSFSLGASANDEWDLGAVVRSCRSPLPAAGTPSRCNSSYFPPPLALPAERDEEATMGDGGRGGSFVGFPDLSQARNGVLELEELCRPFFPEVQQQQQNRPHPPPPPPRRPCSSTSPSPADAAAVAGSNQSPPSRQAHRPLSQIPRSKRRKNQQKKVVCHVPADGLSSDVWAWRKYGQKPIKGSPYPRGYYRCSSSKGCLARKQVERSRTDPAVFIITYTAEHNHPVPTHRNSLAGSTRHKFPSSSPAAAAAARGTEEGGGSLPTGNPSISPLSSSNATGLSPTTPLTASMEDELLPASRRSQEEEDGVDEEEEEEEDDEGMLLVEDMEVVGEDGLLFMSGGADGAAGATSSSAEAEAADAFFGSDGAVGDHRFPPARSRQSKNAAAAAGGR